MGGITIDPTTPTCAGAVRPETRWAPHHAMGAVTAAVLVDGTLSGPAGFTLVAVTSSEPDAGSDGAVPHDIQEFLIGTAETEGRPRAERDGGGDGRISTLPDQATDAAGNRTTCSGTVTVPHDQQ